MPEKPQNRRPLDRSHVRWHGRIIQVLLWHAKLDNTALYAKVATRTVRAITSPLDGLGLFKPAENSPDG